MGEEVGQLNRNMAMAMAALERITTQYIDSQDRVRLAGVSGNAAPVVIWLTQRLLQRLLPVLFQWLQRQDSTLPLAEVFHGFAQQAAQAELTPQVPVQVEAASCAWLALSVDISRSNESVDLTFRGPDGENATLILATKPLRQWLGIIHEAYRQAQWPLQAWPEWLQASEDIMQQRPALLH